MSDEVFDMATAPSLDDCDDDYRPPEHPTPGSHIEYANKGKHLAVVQLGNGRCYIGIGDDTGDEYANLANLIIEPDQRARIAALILESNV